ncbi:response regulator transcription factor [Nonomuraea roseoviolacea]|uniref:Two-component system response regulator DesR n=1 Tax=Nonomuraea roseoviolacea subsp. carminata TaxID=160689 RepID=A0ABT1K8D3_9ACTN|nr:response regulator transcription factor [Nonomuraea roseoviolacea]MCP2350246.1 two-component system response regulator DesR [Nonomuraea roseoviolacea subsp. carminata]
MTTIRVLLAEDQTMFRGAMATLLGMEPDIEVVGDVGRGDEVVGACEAFRPDLALLDIEMPGIDGLEAARRLSEAVPGTKVIIVTTFGRTGYLHAALAAGASGFLLKDAPVTELADAIRRVAAGQRVIDPALAVQALSEGSSPLTPRETEILAASRGHGTIAELARELYLSPGTVRNHLSAAIQKLGARTRAEAVEIAEAKGWLV